jgi:predicted ABC-type ATPase
MCLFPKSYAYNANEPVYYPFERDGAGKTSLLEQFLRQQFPRWVNADEIGRTLSDHAGNPRDLAAASVAEENRERLLSERATVSNRTEHASRQA